MFSWPMSLAVVPELSMYVPMIFCRNRSVNWTGLSQNGEECCLEKMASCKIPVSGKFSSLVKLDENLILSEGGQDA